MIFLGLMFCLQYYNSWIMQKDVKKNTQKADLLWLIAIQDRPFIDLVIQSYVYRSTYYVLKSNI